MYDLDKFRKLHGIICRKYSCPSCPMDVVCCRKKREEVMEYFLEHPEIRREVRNVLSQSVIEEYQEFLKIGAKFV